MFIDPFENVTTLKDTTGPLLFSLEFQVIISLQVQHLVYHSVIYMYLAFISKPFGNSGSDMCSMDAFLQTILP